MNGSKKVSMWIYVAVFAIVLIVGYFAFSGTNKNDGVELQDDVNKEVKSENTKGADMGADSEINTFAEYTMTEVARHDNRNDCWFVIDGFVYDVTQFIKSGQHPGGDAVVAGCGKDATELFKTRPMGSGTPHSKIAEENAKKFIIGVVREN